MIRKSDTLNNVPYALGNYGNNGNQITPNLNSTYSFSNERVSGLNLDITPSIGSGDIFQLGINCELTDIIGWTAAAKDSLTAISKPK